MTQPIPDEHMPPCMRRILNDLKEGIGPPHKARFAFASFALNLGVPQNVVCQAYRLTPNFNERKTEEQVQNIALNGYLPFSCEKMREYGVCEEDMPLPLCKTIKNPLSFARIRALPKDKDGNHEPIVLKKVTIPDVQ